MRTSQGLAGKPAASLRYCQPRLRDEVFISLSVSFIALSATIPNVEDVAEWLEAPPDGVKVYACFY